MDVAKLPNLDPDLADLVALLPETENAFDDIAAARALMGEFIGGGVDLEAAYAGVLVEDVELAAYGSPASAKVFRPEGLGGPMPAIIHFHGGGFCVGSAEMEAPVSAELARDLGAVVVAVEYRLAPEHPYPAGFDDCFAGLRLAADLEEVDSTRIAVYGVSAGGGLAASVALAARDRGGPSVCFQVLDVPVLDDRLQTASMTDGVPMWTRSQAAKSWEMYLAGRPADPYAAPARAESLAGLPPAYVVACEYDPLRDEAIDYAARMLRSGVSVELHTFPGTFHGVALVQGAPVVTRMHDELLTVLRRALKPQHP